jgi:4-diphosphocytidyl-2-C-methyl-D-erythritol kinase
MTLELHSSCKVNLLLNILGRRPDGFHDLETVLQPVAIRDRLRLERGGAGVRLSCTEPSLPVDESNLVHRAASEFLHATGISEGVRIHLVKELPVAAGLGGGSSNAAATLLGLNRLFDHPAQSEALHRIAAGLGSDVPFFLQEGPAIGTGRGEQIEPLAPFEALRNSVLLLVRPAFGVSTPWAYGKLAEHPESLNGQPGRAAELVALLRSGNLQGASRAFYNSLEAPVFDKYPFLAVLKDFLVEEGAAVALLSGSGSTTFALSETMATAQTLREKVLGRFGGNLWTAIAAL